MSGVPAGWETYLEAGERVLWQGQPRPGLSLAGLRPKRIVFGLVFLGFSLVWVVGASRTVGGAPLPVRLLFPLAGLVMVFQGVRLAGGDRLWQAYLRRHTWYTLTSRRALIATEVFGRRGLRDWPITGRSVIDFVEGPPASIFFAGDGQRVGFERIDDGREVLDLMRRVQRGAA